MEINVSQEKGRVPVTVFHIHGDLDANTSDQLENQARQAVEAGTNHLLLDLTHVPYVSSYGIRCLSSIFALMKEKSSGEDREFSTGLRDGTYKSNQLKLAGPNQSVMKVLTTTGMDMFLDIFTDYQKAVQAFHP